MSSWTASSARSRSPGTACSCRSCIEAGIPFTEKPLAGALEVGEKLLQALAQSRSWHHVRLP